MKYLRALFGFLLLVMLAPLAHAGVVDPNSGGGGPNISGAVRNAWLQSHIHFGLENKWTASKSASFAHVAPVPQVFGRWQVDIPFRLSLHLEGARRIDRDFPWEAKAGVSIRVR